MEVKNVNEEREFVDEYLEGVFDLEAYMRAFGIDTTEFLEIALNGEKEE